MFLNIADLRKFLDLRRALNGDEAHVLREERDWRWNLTELLSRTRPVNK